MGYAVQLYFDEHLEAAVLGVRTALTQAGVTPTLERRGDRPHVSLAVLNEVEVSRCVSAVERISREQRSFPVDLAAFGAFPTAQGVVYLSPTPSESLLRLHRATNERLANVGCQVHDHYVPDNWMPHATIGFELSRHEVSLALSWLHGNFKPLVGTFSSIGLIEYLPVKELAAFELAGSGAL